MNRSDKSLGFTLIEVLVGVFIAAVGIVGVLELQKHFIKSGNEVNARALATQLVREQLDNLKNTDNFSTISSGSDVAPIIKSNFSFTRKWAVTEHYYDETSNSWKDIITGETIEGKNEGTNILVVFIPYQSLSQFEELPKLLDRDQEYLASAKDYIDAPHKEAPYVRLESTLMKAFNEHPNYRVPDFSTQKADRVYELRSYQSATEKLHKRKVEMFDSGESDLFVELGFQPMFFGAVISGPVMPNLIYMTCYANEKAQSEKWDAFKVHPTWQTMKKMEKYKNR